MINAINDALSLFSDCHRRNSGDAEAHSRGAARGKERRHDRQVDSRSISTAAIMRSGRAASTLVDAIRDDCGQTGTHIGCEHGFCGACTVIVDGEAVRSCLMFAVQAEASDPHRRGPGEGRQLHPLQRAFMAHHGLQCGFCTPGFLMLA